MNNIAALRRSFGLSQKELAAVLGVAQNTVSNWERGLRQVDTKTLVAISTLFGKSVDVVLGVSPAAPPVAEANEMIALVYGEDARQLFACFEKLNDLGRARAVEVVHDLSQVPRYRKEPEVFALRAARSKGGRSPITGEVSRETLEKLRRAKVVKREKDLK